jgi:hypothetical protein
MKIDLSLSKKASIPTFEVMKAAARSFGLHRSVSRNQLVYEG